MYIHIDTHSMDPNVSQYDKRYGKVTAIQHVQTNTIQNIYTYLHNINSSTE